MKQYLLTAILFLTDSSWSLLADFLELACSLEVDVETTVLVEAFAAEESNYWLLLKLSQDWLSAGIIAEVLSLCSKSLK